jgi:TRAP-type C4-dicarboxylate transport system substrate-binding protein
LKVPHLEFGVLISAMDRHACSHTSNNTPMNRICLSTRVCVAAALLMAGLASAGAQTRWDLPSAYPAINFHSENLVQFAADVERATAGKLKITVHPNASLFKAPDIKRAVQAGRAQIGEILLLNYQNEWQIFGADGQPFLADNYEASAKLYKLQKPLLEKKLSEQGLMLLYAVAWPPQGIFSKKPLHSAADLKGIKWRSYSPVTSRLAELLGAQPVTVQAAELPLAMATGVIESYMSSSATGYDTKTYEHLTYFTDIQAWLPKNAVLVNKAAFDALDPPMQAALLKAAADAETRGWVTSRARNTRSLELLKNNGMTIVAPSAQLKADMQKVGDTVLQEWLQRAGPEGQALVDAYRK